MRARGKWCVLAAMIVVVITPATRASIASPSVRSSVVPDGYRRVAAAHGIPHELFYAVALAESGKRIAQHHLIRPWPWTLNIAGQGQYYASRRAAVAAAHQALARGERSVDFGLMQVNWVYHGQALGSVERAIDPYHNLEVGAAILAGCYRARGDWWDAVGCYHAPNNVERATRYRHRVERIWSRITASG